MAIELDRRGGKTFLTDKDVGKLVAEANKTPLTSFQKASNGDVPVAGVLMYKDGEVAGIYLDSYTVEDVAYSRLAGFDEDNIPCVLSVKSESLYTYTDISNNISVLRDSQDYFLGMCVMSVRRVYKIKFIHGNGLFTVVDVASEDQDMRLVSADVLYSTISTEWYNSVCETLYMADISGCVTYNQLYLRYTTGIGCLNIPYYDECGCHIGWILGADGCNVYVDYVDKDVGPGWTDADNVWVFPNKVGFYGHSSKFRTIYTDTPLVKRPVELDVIASKLVSAEQPLSASSLPKGGLQGVFAYSSWGTNIGVVVDVSEDNTILYVCDIRDDGNIDVTMVKARSVFINPKHTPPAKEPYHETKLLVGIVDGHPMRYGGMYDAERGFYLEAITSKGTSDWYPVSSIYTTVDLRMFSKKYKSTQGGATQVPLQRVECKVVRTIGHAAYDKSGVIVGHIHSYRGHDLATIITVDRVVRDIPVKDLFVYSSYGKYTVISDHVDYTGKYVVYGHQLYRVLRKCGEYEYKLMVLDSSEWINVKAEELTTCPDLEITNELITSIPSSSEYTEHLRKLKFSQEPTMIHVRLYDVSDRMSTTIGRAVYDKRDNLVGYVQSYDNSADVVKVFNPTNQTTKLLEVKYLYVSNHQGEHKRIDLVNHRNHVGMFAIHGNTLYQIVSSDNLLMYKCQSLDGIGNYNYISSSELYTTTDLDKLNGSINNEEEKAMSEYTPINAYVIPLKVGDEICKFIGQQIAPNGEIKFEYATIGWVESAGSGKLRIKFNDGQEHSEQLYVKA